MSGLKESDILQDLTLVAPIPLKELENTPTLTDLTEATLLSKTHMEILSSLQVRLGGEP